MIGFLRSDHMYIAKAIHSYLHSFDGYNKPVLLYYVSFTHSWLLVKKIMQSYIKASDLINDNPNSTMMI